MIMKSLKLLPFLFVALLVSWMSLSAQNVGIETTTPDSTLSIANKVEIGGSQGDMIFNDDMATITFPSTELPNSPMMHMFSSGYSNADRMFLAHSPTATDYGIQYRDSVEQFRFIGNGYHAFSVSIQSAKGKAALGDEGIHNDYTFNLNTNSESRGLNIKNTFNSVNATIGIYADASGNGSGNKFGGHFSAGSGSGNNVGIRATASGGANNTAIVGWAFGPNAKAAHFDAGAVVVDDALLVGTDEKAFGYIMCVNGKIIGEEVRIQDMEDWPDFVFDPAYPLLPLEDLEKSIEQQHHLPGIPSAATVEAEGIDSGEMHRLTIQKVEELTLYVIDLNKENAKLRNTIDELASLVSELQEKVNGHNSK